MSDTPRVPVAPKQHIAPLTPTSDQAVMLYVMIVFTVVIFALWNLPGARNIINPLKLMTIGVHEGFHVIAAIFTGGTVTKITIDPNLGGATLIEGGVPWIILPAGYLGSTFFGAAFILAAWDTLVAKIMSFFIGFGLLAPLALVRDKLTIFLTVCYEGLLIGLWFADHASVLRFYCLFIGMLNIFYAVWDIADERFFRKTNDSDATQFGLLYPRIPAHVWATFWVLFEVAVLISFIFISLASFKLTTDEMRAQADTFLPT